jgi:DNA-binding transcriptional ArsR family regulator
MPQVDDLRSPPLEAAVRFAVRPSLAVELLWLVMLHPGEPDPEFPNRVDRFAGHPEIAERIATLWGDGESCFTEILVIADRGGVLFESDPARFWTGLLEGAMAEPRFELLASETPEDQVRFRRRIARLHDDPGLRQVWLGLLADCWSVVDGRYAEAGRPSVLSACANLESRVGAGSSYADLQAVTPYNFNGRLPGLVAEYSASGLEVTLVPAWYARKFFVLTLDDRLLLSASAFNGPAGPSEATKDRARRFKALGDPTRLAILEAAGRRPRTVGELASLMGIAQPTASTHVRILRDSGLLKPVAGGGRLLEADEDALGHLFRELTETSARRPDVC